MTSPIFYIVLIVVLAALPATVGWNVAKKREQFGRMAGAIIGGQTLLTPGIALIAFSEDRAADENPLQTIIIYGAMALAISIMTFVFLEIRKTHRER
ncbi:MAG: hypothetical protein Pars2KO_00990 [Parasphingorhabdus sp.]